MQCIYHLIGVQSFERISALVLTSDMLQLYAWPSSREDRDLRGETAFSLHGPQPNSEDLRTSQSVNTFKRTLKTDLLSSEFS